MVKGISKFVLNFRESFCYFCIFLLALLEKSGNECLEIPKRTFSFPLYLVGSVTSAVGQLFTVVYSFFDSSLQLFTAGKIECCLKNGGHCVQEKIPQTDYADNPRPSGGGEGNDQPVLRGHAHSPPPLFNNR
jgi:hypothetical protein